MFCNKCGTKNDVDAAFCTNCGNSLDFKTANEENIENQSNQNIGQKNKALYNKPYNENEEPSLYSSSRLLIKDMFNLKKRLGRADYWWGQLGIVLSLLFFTIWVNLTGTINVLIYLPSTPVKNWLFIGVPYLIFFILSWIYLLLVVIIEISSSVRRLHDTNKSGFLVLLCLVPIVGSVAVLILSAMPSVQFNNKWINY